MKKTLTLIAFCVLYGTTSNAQTSDRRFAIGINTGISDYRGELDQHWFNTGHAWRGSIGLTTMYSLSPWFNVGLDGSYGRLGHHVPEGGGIRTNMTQVNGQIRLKFNNGAWLQENSVFQPYIYVGAGFATYGRKPENLYVPGTDGTLNAGAGFAIMATECFGFTYNLNYALTNHDNRDGIEIGYNDQFMIHSAGIVFLLGKKEVPPAQVVVVIEEKDTDGDGIIDRLDDCPLVAGLAKFNGCPDTDNDGIKDSEDRCPQRKGSMALKGCPDSDYDGLADIDDDCPYLYGPVENKGCPVRTQEHFDFHALLDEIQFDFDKSTIKPESYSALDKVAAELNSNEFYYIIVKGHADAIGTDEYNAKLSKERAESVRAYLVAKGVPAEKIITRGFGEDVPEATNTTEEGRAENRRVEFDVKF